MKKRKHFNWAPYLLILPSLVFLAIFFAWPMFRSLILVFRSEDNILNIRAEPSMSAEVVGQIRQSVQVIVLENLCIPPAENEADKTEIWLLVRGEDADGNTIEGWAIDRRIRVDEEDPTSGTVRRRDLDLREEPGPISPIAGTLPVDTPVEILESDELVTWFRVSGPNDAGEEVTGWARYDFIKIISTAHEQVEALIHRGDSGEWTLQYVHRMITDRDFDDALIITILLMVIILPIQFTLAIVMALVLQSRLRGNTLYLYIFSIPLGTSDLAVGIVWYSVFTQSGYLNSLLNALGLIDHPLIFLSPETKHWMILAVVLAEVWRATSLVMVIVVSGLQAIPLEYLEAAELFGAGLWKRLTNVILPLLKPSLQVALILRTILAFQVFGVVIAISGRGLTTLANEAYRWYNEFRNPHVAGAYALFILMLSMITAIFYLRTVRTQIEEGRR